MAEAKIPWSAMRRVDPQVAGRPENRASVGKPKGIHANALFGKAAQPTHDSAWPRQDAKGNLHSFNWGKGK
jgi:hypothetical protein